MSRCWYVGDSPAAGMRISVLFEDPSTPQSPTLEYMNKPTYFETVPLRIDIGSYLCTTVSFMCPSTETFGARRAFDFRACFVFQASHWTVSLNQFGFEFRATR